MDIEFLVDKITKDIMKMIKNDKKKISIISNNDETHLSELLSNDYNVSTDNVNIDSDYVLLSKEKYQELSQNVKNQTMKVVQPQNEAFNKTLSLVGKKVIQERDLKNTNIEKFDSILISNKTIITALAKDIIRSANISVKYEN